MYSYTGGDSRGGNEAPERGDAKDEGGIWVELGDSGKNNVM